MKKSERAEKRAADRFRSAVIAVQSGSSIRKAAGIARLPRSTFHRQLKSHTKQTVKQTHHKRVQTDQEEETIVQVLVKNFDMGKPFTIDDIKDTVHIFCTSLSAERQDRLPFKSGVPGRDFIKGFLNRHQNIIRLGRPAREAEIRWRSCNADVLTTHIAALENIVKENNIDESRIFNLDERGVTPNRDTSKTPNVKFALRKGKSKVSQVRTASFKYVERVTMMATVCGDGTWKIPLFVVKGINIPYRTLKKDNEWVLETIYDCLPEGSFATTRQNNASVDMFNFAEWAERFVQHVKPKNLSGRKVLLTYDGYRSHLTARALSILRDNGVLAYCLPAHTSGKTQPLDVGIYGPFKSYLHKEVHKAGQTDAIIEYDQYDLLRMMTKAFHSSFTQKNIRSAFRKAGIWPVSGDRLLGFCSPRSSEDADTMMTPCQLQELLQQKRLMALESGGLQPVVLKRGYVDTTYGQLVSKDEALAAIKANEEACRARAFEKAAKDAAAVLAFEKERAAKRAERRDFELRDLKRRVLVYGDPDVEPRPLKVRVAAAKEHFRKMKAADAAFAVISNS